NVCVLHASHYFAGLRFMSSREELSGQFSQRLSVSRFEFWREVFSIQVPHRFSQPCWFSDKGSCKGFERYTGFGLWFCREEFTLQVPKWFAVLGLKFCREEFTLSVSDCFTVFSFRFCWEELFVQVSDWFSVSCCF